MSIPAQTNTTDYQVYLRKYLDGLNLQVELNNKNFNANYQFQKNGIQEQTEPADTRSIEERMADIEKLKVQARAMLNKVTDVTNTNEVMSYLIQNPKIMFYFIQNFTSIEDITKKQYSMGILAPQMISLIYSKYLKYNEEVLIPDSNDFDLVSSLMTKEDAEEVKNATGDWDLQDIMDRLIPSIPSRKDIALYTNNPEKYVKQITAFANKYRNGLTIDDVNPVIDALNDPIVYNDDAVMSPILTSFGQKVQIYLGSPPTYEAVFEIELPKKSAKVRKQRDALLPPEVRRRKEENYQRQQTYLAQRSNLKRVTPQEKTIDEIIAEANVSDAMALEIEKQLTAKSVIAKAVARKKAQKKAQAEAAAQAQAEAAAEAAAQAAAAAAATPATDQPEPVQLGSGLLNNRDKHIHRYKVLKGEVLAGNTSPSVVKELRSLVVKMVKLSELDPNQAMMILKELKR